MNRLQTILAGAVLFLAACGGPLKYTVPSPKALGADAKIVADVKADQHQTLLEIKALNLAPADRVAAGTQHYVLWQRKDANSQWTRVGTLVYDDKDREGKFEGSVPETAFDLSITAEKDAGAAAPSAEVVFSQHVN